MTLHIIGIGLGDEKDITVRGLEIVKRCSAVYLENYTAVLQCPVSSLESLYGQKVILADRNFVEKNPDPMLYKAKSSDVAFLVVGDAMSATTHVDLVLRARKEEIAVRIVPNASILTAVGAVGLELYKYGKTVSVVFPEEGVKVESFYDGLKWNLDSGLHTLCLLDIKTAEPTREGLKNESGSEAQEARFMTVSEGIQALLAVEKNRSEGVFTADAFCIGCARVGCDDARIVAGKASDLLDVEFGGPMHCLIVPGKLHFMEEDALALWKQ